VGFGGRPRLQAVVIGSRWLGSRLVDVSCGSGWFPGPAVRRVRRCDGRWSVPVAAAWRLGRGCRRGGGLGRVLPGRVLPPGSRGCHRRWPAGCRSGRSARLTRVVVAAVSELPVSFRVFLGGLYLHRRVEFVVAEPCRCRAEAGSECPQCLGGRVLRSRAGRMSASAFFIRCYRLGWSWVCAIFCWSHQENHPR